MPDPIRFSQPDGQESTRREPDDAWRRYGFAVVFVALATLLTWALDAMFSDGQSRTPFALFYAAVVLATWYGGRGPGLSATFLSALVCVYFFLLPAATLVVGFHVLLRAAVFLMVSLLVSSLMERSRRAEKAAHKSSEALATTLKSIGDAVITTDERGRITFMNSVAQTLTGWTEDEARGRELSEVFRIVNEETRAGVGSPVAEVLREGHVVSLANHTLLLAKDGTELAIDDSGAPIRDAAGNVVGVVLVFHNITERRAAEEALLRRERELSDFIENASVGLHWVSGDGTILWANRAELNMLGYAREEYIGHHIAEFHADPEVISDILGRLTNNETLHDYEARLRCKDGTIRHTIINSNVMWENGKFVHTRCFTRDITERKLAEEALRESEGRLRAIAETASDAIITIDEESRILFVNTAAGKIFGYTGEEMTGRSLTTLMPDYMRRAHESALARYVETGRKHISWELIELPGLHKDGHELSLEVSFAEFMKDGRRYFTGVARDISERKQAEAVRSQLAAIVESSNDAIFGKTLEGVVTSWNKGAERIYGYTAEEIIGQHISIVIPPEHRYQLTEILDKIKAGGKVEQLEAVRVRKDGRRINASLTISSIKDKAGTIIGASTIARDITEQKHIQEVMRESERRYRYLAESMPQIVWTARPDGYLDYYNQRWFDYTGMTLEQTQGWGWQPVLHPEDVERCLRMWAKSVATGDNYEVEYRFKRASDGAYRWHLGRAEPMRDEAGNIVKWFGTATDIHDRKQSAEALRFMAEASEILTSSLDYETTLESLARLSVSTIADYCLIDVAGDDGQIRRIATAHRDPAKEELAYALRSYPPDPHKSEGIPKVLRTGKPQIVPRVDEEMLKTLTLDEEHAGLLRRLGLKSYMTLPLRARERTVGALTFGITESERAYTSADLTFAQELARRAALAVDNARLYSRAQEANKAKDEFLATLSHELRTPLTPIIGWLQMIRDGRITETDTRHGLQIIEKNSQALTRLINDLLDMSSILSGKMRIERVPVEIGEVVREAVETIRTQADNRGIPLEIATCDGDARPLVSGDRTRLVQVFWNLLNNAVKFSDAGQRVRVECETRDREVRVTVADEGRGIEANFIPHVFERFRQADSSTTRVYGGLGIGLALVKSFVEAHGGEVAVESPGQGQGSRFVVILPLLGAQSNEGAVEAPPEEVEPCVEEVCRVLVIEDAPDTLDMLQIVFESRGFHATTCSTAEEALSIAQTASFDIIVSDIGLPQIDGYELIKRLRDVPHLHDVPAVALTGYAAPKDAESALAAGYDMHIPKPVDPAVLASEIEQLLQRKKAHADASDR
ncbi:MAG: PAS domain S-box protein [Acidobacteria bacterium]|nr:PAS domain S-box protein [Acidobacteriota bacterium]